MNHLPSYSARSRWVRCISSPCAPSVTLLVQRGWWYSDWAMLCVLFEGWQEHNLQRQLLRPKTITSASSPLTPRSRWHQQCWDVLRAPVAPCEHRIEQIRPVSISITLTPPQCQLKRSLGKEAHDTFSWCNGALCLLLLWALGAKGMNRNEGRKRWSFLRFVPRWSLSDH